MTHRVGAKGQVVIPKEIREEIGIEPGDEVTFEPDGKDIRVRRIADEPEARRKRVSALRGRFASVPGFSTDALEADRREEREREARRDRNRAARRST
jgi:AbrB family looped-hinge helix DNA binding protein